MEVILLVDVKGVGKKNETKTVNDGYANNYLIPRKLAVRKTEGSIATLNKQKEDEAKLQAELKEKAYKVFLENLTLEFKAKAQKDGSMAGTISTKAIAEKLKNDYNIEIDKRKFVDKLLVNAFGTTNLKIELYKNIVATIKVHVSEDK